MPSIARSPTRESFGSDLWDEENRSEHGGYKTSVKKDEPMSPVTVVLYVVCFYLVWQILTRSDDNEILSHLPSSFKAASETFQQRPSSPPTPQQPYHLPYALPHLPSPIAPSNPEASTWRVVLGAIVYPVYIAITLIAIPMPFLIAGLSLIFSIINTILYPVTSTLRLLARTFILAPLNVVRSFLLALYPVYVFVGGVVGAGAILGVTFGWAGRILTDLLIGPSQSRRRKAKKTKARRGSRERAASRAEDDFVYAASRSRRASAAPEVPPTTRSRSFSAYEGTASRPTSKSYERRYLPIVDVVEIAGDELLDYEDVHATGREGMVVGLRRRSGRL